MICRECREPSIPGLPICPGCMARLDRFARVWGVAIAMSFAMSGSDRLYVAPSLLRSEDAA